MHFRSQRLGLTLIAVLAITAVAGVPAEAKKQRYKSQAATAKVMRAKLRIFRSQVTRISVPVGLEARLSRVPGVMHPENARGAGPSNAVTVVPGEGTFCITHDAAGGGWVLGCSTTQTLAAGKPVVGFFRDGSGWTLWGLVPDGVTDVTVTTSAKDAAVAIKSNGIDVTLSARPATLTYTDRADKRHTLKLAPPGA